MTLSIDKSCTAKKTFEIGFCVFKLLFYSLEVNVKIVLCLQKKKKNYLNTQH